MSFLYWLDWKSKHFNWNTTKWKATQPSLRVFSGKLFKWEPRKSFAKFDTNPYNIVACLPNPYKLSILGDIWRATILPFSSSKYFYSWQRLSNLVDLSFEYLSFSNKRKTTILFPSPLTFLQLPMHTYICTYTHTYVLAGSYANLGESCLHELLTQLTSLSSQLKKNKIIC